MVRKMMHGQYFIITSILFASLFFSIIYSSLTPSMISESEHRDIFYFFRNILDEYPYAFNNGMNTTSINDYLINFTNFTSEIALENNMYFRTLWLYTHNESSGINITLYNFMNDSVVVNLTIDGNSKQVIVPLHSINTTSFKSVDDVFNLTITFYNVQTKILLGMYKYNFYAYVELGRSRAMLEGDMVA